MDTIAISEDGRTRVIMCGYYYLLQTKINCINYWNTKEETEHEWLASKWILDFELRVGSDYPTIAEIRETQKRD